MPKSKTPFRRSQVVRPPSGRQFGKVKIEKKTFDIYVSDIDAFRA